MKIVVTGASGNVGTGLLRALAQRDPAHEVMALSRRPAPSRPPYGTARRVALDVGEPDAAERLAEVFAGADAVAHLAWAVQPVRDEPRLRRVNVGGTEAVLAAAAAAGVRQVLFTSSLGVYAHGAREPIDESWPATGVPSSQYSRHKVAVERLLDRFAAEHPDVVVSRARPTLITQRAAAHELARYFLGRVAVRPLLGVAASGKLPLVPLPAGLRLQLAHADDVGEALARMLERGTPGAVNLAAEPLDAGELAALFGGRAVPVPRLAARVAVSALWRARVLALSPGWYDLSVGAPILSVERARAELDWAPRWSSADAVRDALRALADDAAGPTPVLRD